MPHVLRERPNLMRSISVLMQVTARGLQHADDPRRRVVLLRKPCFDHFRTGVKQKGVQHFGIGFRQRAQLRWEREDDVVMFESRQLAQDRGGSMIGFILSTPGAKAILARMIDEPGDSTTGTLIHVGTKFRGPTRHDLIRRLEHVRRNVALSLVHVLIPVGVQNFGKANHRRWS